MTPVIKSVAVVSLSLCLPLLANAQYVAQRLLCENDKTSRLIELHYEDSNATLPCVIKQQIPNEPTTVLWRARYQQNFCTEQVGRYREKLVAVGMQCQWLPVKDSTPDAQPPADAIRATQAATANNLTTSAIKGLQSTVAENNHLTLQPYSAQSSLDDTPGDAATTADEWVIFLSAKTLASIKDLLANAPAGLDDYLQYEQQQAQSIYGKLQMRIDYLTKLAGSPQQSASLSDLAQ